MTAPTEGEIRATVREGFDRISLEDQLDFSEGGIFDALAPFMDSQYALPDGTWAHMSSPKEPHVGTLWANMPPIQADELTEGVEAILKEVERAAAAMLEQRLVEFAVGFAAKYPDLDRGTYRPRVAVPA